MKNLIITLLFFIGSYQLSFTQGCSDAGFCSINGMAPSSHLDSTKTLKQQFSIGITNGLAQFGVFISSPYLQYGVQATKGLDISIKLNYIVTSGTLTSTNGFSDLFISTNYKITEKISMINGVKTPFNNADKKYKGYELPMSYQTSLGTVDYLAGLSYRNKNILISLGTQIPIIQNNNSFFVENFVDNGINENYISTNNYVRKADIIARFNYVAPLKKEKIKLTIGVLPIYHISNDEYTDIHGIKQSIQRSQGLTLNVNSVMRYKFSEINNFDFTIGIPVMSREKRPDGLSQLAVNLQYGIKF